MDQNNNSSCVNYEQIEKLIPSQIKQLRLELQDKHNLVIPEQCTEFLARCLRLKDGNLEKAIKLIKSFRVSIDNFGSWDANFIPSTYRQYCKNGVPIFPLRKRDSNGRVLLVARIELWNPKEANFDQVLAAIWMIVQFGTALLQEVQRDGFVAVVDLAKFSMQHAWSAKQWRLISLMKWAQNGVLERVRACHVINHPKVAQVIYNAIKPLMKEKLRKRIILHENVDSLLHQVGENYLPSYLGGTLDPETCVDMELIEGWFGSDQYFQDMMDNGFPPK